MPTAATLILAALGPADLTPNPNRTLFAAAATRTLTPAAPVRTLIPPPQTRTLYPASRTRRVRAT